MNKKDILTDYLENNDISVCCMQETEVPANFPAETLSCNNYVCELEQSYGKRRAGIFLRAGIEYQRRTDLEEKDCHIVIVDKECTSAFFVAT